MTSRSDASGLRIFLAIWFLVLGASIVILPSGPLSPRDDLAWLRGLITAGTGLAILWLAPLGRSEISSLAHLAMGVVQIGFALRLVGQGGVAGGATLLVLAIATAALPLYAAEDRGHRPLPRYPLATVLSLTIALNGAAVMTGGDRLDAFLAAAGVAPVPYGLAMIIVGVLGAVVAATGRPGRKAVAVTTIAGAVLLLAVATMGSLRVSSSYWVLNATVYVRAVGLVVSAWTPSMTVDWRSAIARATVTLATVAVVPQLLLATVLFWGPTWGAEMSLEARQALFGLVTGLLVASTAIALLVGRQLTRPLLHMASVLHASPGRLGSPEMAAPITEVEDLRLAITDMYDELEARNVELTRANAAKDEFLGLVSHELKTPVTTILAGSALLAHGVGAYAEEIAADIEDEAQRLAAIIDNLLALARVESAGVSTVEPILLRHLVAAVADLYVRREPSRVFEVEGRRDVIVEGAPEHIAMIVDNFLSNAVKYSPPRSPITIRVTAEGDFGSVTVRDVGDSLTPDEAARVFDAFYRTPVAEKMASGVGIGLAVCSRIARSLGGDVGVTVTPGAGTEFALRLPLAADDDADPGLVTDHAAGEGRAAEPAGSVIV
ncbi:MAG TPA: HAMP domain-containing sensor histidine kinase [Candidatus Limnocylindrales bacterium]|nr:HAMP domain-containing sensor histidine kinase [Candidatus Limnocylindrales bacterium]